MQKLFYTQVNTVYKSSFYFTLYIKITLTKTGYSEKIHVFNGDDVKSISHVQIVVLH
jgi:hypothetical protein